MRVRRITWLFLLMIIVTACSTDDGYDLYRNLEQKEMSSGLRYDSIFLGIGFGMTTKEFYGHCWELNKKGLLTDGANNTAVEYKLNDQLGKPAFMNFYPEFHGNRIWKMKALFRYTAWAPWNRKLYADSLQTEVTSLLKRWHKGNPFIKISDKEKGDIFVKVDGNRRITVGRFDDMHVKVDYTDLVVDRQLKGR